MQCYVADLGSDRIPAPGISPSITNFGQSQTSNTNATRTDQVRATCSERESRPARILMFPSHLDPFVILGRGSASLPSSDHERLARDPGGETAVRFHSRMAEFPKQLGEELMRRFESCPNLSSRKTAAFALLAVCMIVGYAQRMSAQSGMNCHATDTREELAPEKLPPPQKLTGIGNAHIRITATPEAQMWFDQGLNLLHDFWDYESVRAFEQSVRVDPRCAMCYWGIYQAEIFRHSSSKHFAEAALAKAVSLKTHASKTERLYIEASEASEADDKSEKKDKRESKEVQLYRKLVKHYPADLQARIFLAQAVGDGYDDSGQPNAGQKEELSILQSVMKADHE